MKLRNKLALYYSLFTGALLLAIGLYIYFISAQFRQEDFNNRLQKRASIAGQMFLKKDEVNAQVYQDIREQFFQKLPSERDTVIKIENGKVKLPVAKYTYLTQEFFDQAINDSIAEIQNGKQQTVGILYHDNEGDYIVISTAYDEQGYAKLLFLRNALITAYIVSIGLIFLLGRIYAGQVLKPIAAIVQNAKTIEATSLDKRLHVKSNSKDELSELTNTFNAMLSRLEISFEIQNNFISNASHEFRNPLTAILGEIEIATSKQRSVEEYLNSLNTIRKESERLEHLTASLLEMAQTGFSSSNLVKESVRIDELLLDIKEEMNHIRPDNKVQLDFSELPKEVSYLEIAINKSLLHVALRNIIDNACKFSDNKQVNVSIACSQTYLLITVIDQGVGIPLNDLKHIYEPFYRATNVRSFKGFGIGLPLTQKIMLLHKGTIEVSSIENEGTTVKIKLPRKDS